VATPTNVLEFLIPSGNWILVGNEYEGITFTADETITKDQFEAGFAQYDAWKAEQDAQALAKKAAAEAKLAALGLTSDDLKALGLGGN
jgi:hypothetical protein